MLVLNYSMSKLPKLNLRHNLPLLISLVVVTAAIPLTVFVALTQNMENRGRAQTTSFTANLNPLPVTEFGTIVQHSYEIQNSTMSGEGASDGSNITSSGSGSIIQPQSPSLVDFSKCSQQDGFMKYFNFGSFRLQILGNDGDNCQVKVISEIEQGYTNYDCQIPKSLGNVTFNFPYDNSINLSSIMSPITPYCQTSPSECIPLPSCVKDNPPCDLSPSDPLHPYCLTPTPSTPPIASGYYLQTYDGRLYPLRTPDQPTMPPCPSGLNCIQVMPRPWDFSQYLGKTVLVEGILIPKAPYAVSSWWPLPRYGVSFAVYNIHQAQQEQTFTAVNFQGALVNNDEALAKEYVYTLSTPSLPVIRQCIPGPCLPKKILARSSVYDLSNFLNKYIRGTGMMYNVEGTIYYDIQTLKNLYPTPTPPPGCRPRPGCLDSVPRCLPPEPAEGWCPLQVSLDFNPSTLNSTINTPFTSNLTINTNGKQVTAVDLVLTFDPLAVKINNLTPTNSLPQTLGPVSIDNNSGRAHIVLAVNPTAPVSGNNMPILTLSGKTLSQQAKRSIISINSESLIAAVGFDSNVLSSVGQLNLQISSLPGDLNQDGKIDIFDYNLIVQNFTNNTCGNMADIDGNCKVDIFDYNILVTNFGKSSTITPTPTPTP